MTTSLQRLWNLLTEKEKPVAKTPTVIQFTGGDYKPTKLASGLIGFKAPFEFSLQPGQSQDIDLLTKCSVALLFTGGQFVQPGEDVKVRVANQTVEVQTFQAGDVIARAYPLLPVDYTIL